MANQSRAGAGLGISGSTGAPLPTILRMIVSVLRGLLEGALPIIILVAILALFWEALTIAKYATVPYGYSVTQTAQTIVALGGIVISLVVFLVTGMRTMRGVRDRHLDGDLIESSITMVVFAVSLLVILMAVLNTIGMPQHPAP
jgi:hypothetical protein